MTRSSYKLIQSRLIALHKSLRLWNSYANDKIYNLLDVTTIAV